MRILRRTCSAPESLAGCAGDGLINPGARAAICCLSPPREAAVAIPRRSIASPQRHYRKLAAAIRPSTFPVGRGRWLRNCVRRSGVHRQAYGQGRERREWLHGARLGGRQQVALRNLQHTIGRTAGMAQATINQSLFSQGGRAANRRLQVCERQAVARRRWIPGPPEAYVRSPHGVKSRSIAK